MSDNYKAGDYISVTNDSVTTTFEIMGVDNSWLRLRDNLSLIESTRKRLEVNELILQGQGKLIPKDVDERKLTEPLSLDFSSYPDKQKAEARRRYKYIAAIIELNPKGFTEKYIKPVINEIAKNINDSPPSIRTVNYWIKSYLSAGSSIRGLLPKHKEKGNFSAKVEKEVESYIQLAIDHFKQEQSPSVSCSHDHMATLIHNDNSHLAANLKLKVPTVRTFTKRLSLEAPVELMAYREGKKAAKMKFKQSKLVRHVELILQRAEIDHTKLDLFVVDDKTRMVLGRPWVTVLLDYKSKSVLGFYIGFENPSYLSVARALHHALSSKSYVKNLYPDIQNEWLCAGRPAVIATDRGKEFRSVAFADACLELNITIQHNPAKHPWFKGTVERFFSSLNQTLLSDEPGKVMTRITDSTDYNPEKNAIISMSKFMEIFHMWVIDIYQCKPKGRQNIIPKYSWLEDLDKVPINIENPDKLRLILSESFSPYLSEVGIIKDYIVYDSEELTRYRSKYGFGKVKIKRARDDLGQIYVYDEKSNKYFEVKAVNQDYAKGLSMFQHQIHKKFAKYQLDAKVDLESIARARIKIIEIVNQVLSTSSHKKIADKQRLARYRNVGQQEGGATKGSLEKNELRTDIGIPKPIADKSKKHLDNGVPSSDYDGLNNEFPDDLDF